jgi:hypothetical protein
MMINKRHLFLRQSMLLIWLLGAFAFTRQVNADEQVPYAPAVVFRSVEWWGPGAGGAMWWWAGKNQTPYPADLGRIKEVQLVGKQQIEWLGRTYDIEKVMRTDAGNFEVTFDTWRLVMGKTHEDRWLVDTFPPDKRFVTARFRTITKATAHLDGK